MNRQIVSFAFVLLFAVCSVAQDIPKEEIYGGYTFVRFNASAPVNAFTANGGVGSFQYNFNKWIGLAAELGGVHNGALSIGSSGTFTPDQTAFTYLFGPRVFLTRPAWSPRSWSSWPEACIIREVSLSLTRSFL